MGSDLLDTSNGTAIVGLEILKNGPDPI